MAQASSSDLGDWAAPIRAFVALVEAHDLHGLLFQHLDLCERRAWLHLQRVDYAHLEERMKLGAVAHELHRPRDRSVEGLMGLAPDRIDWAGREVIEAKGSAGARRAVSMQTLFYALLLMAATGRRWSAANEIVGGRKKLPVAVGPEEIARMLEMARRLEELTRTPLAPPAARKSICESCSYRFLCGFA
ncbi:Dna2/Cas4 domain-containing protein [Neomegalonema sp.]|uniref:Dna2/Cas4 domain-containing protein n=1 Tax=Neomegalonema sp. TaxID=2039713 RepID=UPI002620543D|nr:Dna2/Cas4 domain-containing protein [Neomegalonema sp.]MDD2867482.1 Dna2/Cas4 domain-containing protein [Neomegalonema sp.]